MATKLRLQRYGKKAHAYFHIVVADGRAPRDGKYIEQIGSYNPNTNPATIELNFDKALAWLEKGAQPSDTCRAILSYKGVIYKNHLLKGVKKGALTAEQAEAKFAKWLEEKESKISGKKDRLSKEKQEAAQKTKASETQAKEAKAAKVAEKLAAEAKKAEEKTAEPQATETPQVETPAVETPPAEENNNTEAQ
jgi:small subunit ribosomal protein S16